VAALPNVGPDPDDEAHPGSGSPARGNLPSRRSQEREREIDTDGGEKIPSGRARRAEREIDRRASQLAAAQFGIVTRTQLTAAGLGDRAIDNWLRRGRLILRHHGVYALGHTALPPFSSELAAVMACEPAALLSHDSAAYLWGFRKQPPGEPHVTVVGRDARNQRNIRVHKVKHMDPTDARNRDGIPVTSPARTIIDIAPSLDARELELALHEALALKLVTIQAVKAALERYPHRRGTATLTALINQPHGARTRSPPEEDLLRLLRRGRLPKFFANARIGPWNADFYWPEHKLVVEVDGIDFHSSRLRIERDHRKDLDLRARGIDVVRFVPRQVRREPEMVLVTIARELARREP
jgi:very-short-patch-repair endonuclease